MSRYHRKRARPKGHYNHTGLISPPNQQRQSGFIRFTALNWGLCHPSRRSVKPRYKDAKNFLYLGRGFNFPVALEGALKLKEISYIHAEGYPAAEMKHGPIALIDENMPVVFLATNQSAYEKIVSNVQEVKARKGKIIAIVNEGDTQIKALADHVIEIPATEEILSPLLTIVPLQLLSYHIAILRGCNVDQPRNLAKSVTVE